VQHAYRASGVSVTGCTRRESARRRTVYAMCDVAARYRHADARQLAQRRFRPPGNTGDRAR